jgi:hypothetical protein
MESKNIENTAYTAVESSVNGSQSIPQDLIDVMKVLPKDAMKLRLDLAFFTLFRVIFFFAFTSYLLYISPWYLLPLAWVFLWYGLHWVICDCS